MAVKRTPPLTQEQLATLREELEAATKAAYTAMLGENVELMFDTVESLNAGKTLRKLTIRAHRAGRKEVENGLADVDGQILIDAADVKLVRARGSEEEEETDD